MRVAVVVARLTLTATVVCTVAACPPKFDVQQADRKIAFRGEHVGDVHEAVTATATGPRQVERRVHLRDLPDDVVTIAHLDDEGHVVQAWSLRPGLRELELRGKVGHQEILDGHGDALTLDAKPVLLLDTLALARPKGPHDVKLVDLSSGEAIAAHVERRGPELVVTDSTGVVVARANPDGARTGPGAFAEGDEAPRTGFEAVQPVLADATHKVSLYGLEPLAKSLRLNGPGQVDRTSGTGTVVVEFDRAAVDATKPTEADTRPALFLESTDARVIGFAHQHGKGVDAVADATSLIDAVKPKIDAKKSIVPPSAINMIERGGDCDGAAALITASLRALGHASRVVVGYRALDGKLVPHAWSEVYTPQGWLMVDATVPGVGILDGHLRLFEGLGGAFTMGRVLGRLRAESAP